MMDQQSTSYLVWLDGTCKVQTKCNRNVIGSDQTVTIHIMMQNLNFTSTLEYDCDKAAKQMKLEVDCDGA